MGRGEILFVNRRTAGFQRLGLMLHHFEELCSQPWSQAFPEKLKAPQAKNLRFQLLEPQVPTAGHCGCPKVGGTGSYFEDLRVPTGWTPGFPILELWFQFREATGSQSLVAMVPTFEPRDPIFNIWKFGKLRLVCVCVVELLNMYLWNNVLLFILNGTVFFFLVESMETKKICKN